MDPAIFVRIDSQVWFAETVRVESRGGAGVGTSTTLYQRPYIREAMHSALNM